MTTAKEGRTNGPMRRLWRTKFRRIVAQVRVGLRTGIPWKNESIFKGRPVPNIRLAGIQIWQIV
ncbi:hypothetical protein NQ318_009594 [Aromia moschata]|uniref:Uncharacterized protein n=1 Tax=Aromia moschata TaxID=1265417 RepID=A0AAV8XAD6_9CUCU|nr:hypothetical protein NQ318_009594 [Aromia moschata]